MKAIVCEMCGSTDIVKKDGYFVCQSCGVKYTPDEAKKMMIEGTVSVRGAVSLDTSEDVKNLYILARRALNDKDIETANKYYGQLLEKKPNDWEPNFFLLYNKAQTISQVTKKLPEIFRYLKRQHLSDEERDIAVKCICNNCTALAKTGLNNASRVYDNAVMVNKGVAYYNEHTNNLIANSVAGITMFRTLGDTIISELGDDYSAHAVAAWKNTIEAQENIVNLYPSSERVQPIATVVQYTEKVKKYEPEYEFLPRTKPYTREANFSLKIKFHKKAIIFAIIVLSILVTLIANS